MTAPGTAANLGPVRTTRGVVLRSDSPGICPHGVGRCRGSRDRSCIGAVAEARGFDLLPAAAVAWYPFNDVDLWMVASLRAGTISRPRLAAVLVLLLALSPSPRRSRAAAARRSQGLRERAGPPRKRLAPLRGRRRRTRAVGAGVTAGGRRCDKIAKKRTTPRRRP